MASATSTTWQFKKESIELCNNKSTHFYLVGRWCYLARASLCRRRTPCALDSRQGSLQPIHCALRTPFHLSLLSSFQPTHFPPPGSPRRSMRSSYERGFLYRKVVTVSVFIMAHPVGPFASRAPQWQCIVHSFDCIHGRET